MRLLVLSDELSYGLQSFISLSLFPVTHYLYFLLYGLPVSDFMFCFNRYRLILEYWDKVATQLFWKGLINLMALRYK